MSDTESDIEDIPHDETVKKLQVPEFQDSPTSSGGITSYQYFWNILISSIRFNLDRTYL